MALPSYKLVLLICLSYQTTGKELHPNFTARNWSNVAQGVSTAAPTSRSFFSSRLEYSNKWLPVGRGDPLNNDPTYDYSPPAADHRVHYWDEKSTKTSGNKNEILLLGVSSRRQYSHNYNRKPSDIREPISTVMLPPPIQPIQKVNFKIEMTSNRQPSFGAHNTWQENAVAESNVQPTIVLPNTVHNEVLLHFVSEIQCCEIVVPVMSLTVGIRMETGTEEAENDSMSTLRPDDPGETVTSASPGASILCHLCPPGRAKTYKGTKGFKLHCNSAHPDYQVSSSTLDPIEPANDGIPLSTRNDQLLEYLRILKSNIRVIKRIPKAPRFCVSQDFTKALEDTVANINSFEAWFRLLSFPFVVFKAPDRKNKETSKLSLATCVKRNLKFWNEIKHLPFQQFFESFQASILKQRKKKTKVDSDESRIKRSKSKLNDGDIKGAIRILSSDESVAPINQETYLKLLDKHPAPEIHMIFDDTTIPPIDIVTETEVRVAVSRFENGSAGGLDGLRPQHLKDMMGLEIGDYGNIMLTRLSRLSDLLLNGKAPDFIIPIVYGASLCALNKKDFTIRPIAVGCVYRRLVSKIACARVADKLGSHLKPKQIGFATKGGAEAGAHAARAYINSHHESPKVFLKLDYSNAFNELERDPMLKSAYEVCPEIYPFLKQCYSTPTKLIFGDYTIISQRGCQQGDPCGPPIFCLTIHEMVTMLNSELNIWYLDDGSLGGTPDVVLNDLKLVIEKSANLGLRLNFAKCELMVLGAGDGREATRIFEMFNAVLPGIKLKDTEIELLGSPLTDAGIPRALTAKKDALERMVDRLKKLNSHQAFFLLRHSFSIPRLTYTIRTTPCWRAMDSLNEYDQLLRISLEGVNNCQLDSDAWIECSLSAKCGGLGIRNVTSLCFPSFLGSYHSVSDLMQQILPSHIQLPKNLVEEALTAWQSFTGKEALVSPLCKFQHLWDETLCASIHDQLLENSSSEVEKARILANVAQDSSAWLNALPCSSLGTLLDNQTFRIATSLRLGLPVCHPHTCVCGKPVDKFGRHGLACKRSYGRKSRHDTINDLIKRALLTCGFPALREPTGCSRSDGKKPDGLTLIPWKCGKPLIWDFTSADTTCHSYVASTSRRAGAAASVRENSKRTKYRSLDNFHFCPISIETMGPWGKDGKKLIDEIGKKLNQSTGESRSKSFLIQRISIANQRGNAASILGTMPQDVNKLDEIFYIVQ